MLFEDVNWKLKQGDIFPKHELLHSVSDLVNRIVNVLLGETVSDVLNNDSHCKALFDRKNMYSKICYDPT